VLAAMRRARWEFAAEVRQTRGGSFEASGSTGGMGKKPFRLYALLDSFRTPLGG